MYSLNTLIQQDDLDRDAIKETIKQLIKSNKMPYFSVRKKKTVVCNGRCFDNLTLHFHNEIRRIPECSNHAFCEPCLKSHFRERLSQNPHLPIPCPACEIGGISIVYADTKWILRYFIPSDEYNDYVRLYAANQHHSQCISGFEQCPIKGKFLSRNRLLVLKCEDTYCADCFGVILSNKIDEEVEGFFLNVARNQTNLITFSFTCPNNHVLRGNRLEDTLLLTLQTSSLIPAQRKAHYAVLMTKYLNYFKGQPMYKYFCVNCQEVVVDGNIITMCPFCKKCMKCDSRDHPNYNCDE